jgi:hypothetical protein
MPVPFPATGGNTVYPLTLQVDMLEFYIVGMIEPI